MTLNAARSPLPGRRAIGLCLLLVVGATAVLPTAAVSQSPMPGGMPPPPGMSLAQSAAMRFPQPVRVGDLLGRDVLQPVESRSLIGTVRQVARTPDGTLVVVVSLGSVLGFGGRRVAIPVDAMVVSPQSHPPDRRRFDPMRS
jgi:acyl dehydratase